ncbi:transglutaminase family protein [Croceicoccus mobilis]|uniref:Transglutaminase n=1 Tax=Croceicoccus mobilis TaxID=1703339 RepID=A0A916YY68_9SPHN|nr:transglutaminase family protein [Croceicoccus mobilis]GGD65397.1 transglutaminase [Croceicoccus mobilis]
MRLAVHHRTKYTFREPVVHALQRLHLTPKSTSGQTVVEWNMRYTGAHEELHYDDHNMNTTVLIAVDPGVHEVVIECEGIVDTADNAGVIGRHAGHLPRWHFLSQTKLTKPGPKMKALAQQLARNEDSTLDTLHSLCSAVLEEMEYQTGETDAETRAEDALAAGKGVCQDHAHVFIGIARHLGIPARYVSGYLMMDERVEQEASHAWAEAYVDDLGWVGFDISNKICPDERYIRVATGRDYGEAAPITGIQLGGMSDSLTVELAVENRGASQSQSQGANGQAQAQSQQSQSQG